MKQSKLFFCGAWDLEPLISWPWQSHIAMRHFQRLSGLCIRPFTHLDYSGLHAQYFLAADVARAERYFRGLGELKQITFLRRLLKDYWRESKKAEAALHHAARLNLKSLSARRIDAEATRLYAQLSTVTYSIWFVLFLDDWFPNLGTESEIKKIGQTARDHSGRQHEPARPLKREMWAALGSRLGIAASDMLYLFPEEIRRVINGAPVPYERITERRKRFVTVTVNNRYRMYGGAQARAWERRYLPRTKKRAPGRLRGRSAYPGVVTGRARVVRFFREIGDFKTGEILVAPQTLVDYVPIMRKSKAILTEYGGITSHAAVVSRELGVPCVVGISGLLQNVHTGDRVEVDAERGVVKKM